MRPAQSPPLTRFALGRKFAELVVAIAVGLHLKGSTMSRKLLLLLAVIMVCNTVAANASLVSHKGPPPRCNINPNDPRCRNN